MKKRIFIITLTLILLTTWCYAGWYYLPHRRKAHREVELTIQPATSAGKNVRVLSNNGNTNYETQQAIEIGYRSATAGIGRGLFQYDISGIPAGAELISAIFYIYMGTTNENETDTDTFLIHRITESWAASTVTYNNKPAYNAGTEASLSITGMDIGWKEFNITTLVGQWRDLSYPNYGIICKATTEAAAGCQNAFYSSYYMSDTTKRAKLVIVYRG